ncbi:MAG: 1-deoxy-D-xylulose-5-phosphate reductoisomerase [Chloroflexota bacterium]
MVRNVVVLGSTGSIGRQTLDVIRLFPDRVQIFGLAAGTNVELLGEQAHQFRPKLVCVGAGADKNFGRGNANALRGDEGIVELVTHPEVDLVVVGTSGSAGLLPTLAALDSGKAIALANKETLIMAGSIIREKIRSGSGQLVPVDSEHSAIWQCIEGEPQHRIERMTLTASGGALRHLSLDELDSVSPQQALQHPTWHMGKKITIDSANLMNKGLEVVEAHWLFNVPYDKIDVVLHPQSIVHSFVTFDDSATKAQLGFPDMRLPIQYALSHPDRWKNDFPRLDLQSMGTLQFAPVDHRRYPALRLAIEAGRKGGTFPTVLCAADEVAVDAFLNGRIPFTRIPTIIEGALERHNPCQSPELGDILEADIWARSAAASGVAAI